MGLSSMTQIGMADDVNRRHHSKAADMNKCNLQRCLATGIGSRASGTTIRDNYIQDTTGAGVRLGGWLVDGVQYGINNKVCLDVLLVMQTAFCQHSCVEWFADNICIQ